MKIRFFNVNDTAAPFFRNLAPFLASEGHEVEIVLSKAAYRAGNRLGKAVGHLDNIRVIRTVNFGLSRTNSLTKFFVMLAYVIQASLHSLFGPSVDCNVFLTQPPLFALWGYVLSKVRGQPYYCVTMDIYPQLLVELGIMSRETPLTQVLTRLSKFALRQAEGVIVIGRRMAQQVVDMGVASERVHFIHNWADERVIHSVDHADNSLRIDQGWQDKFVILYAGNIGVPQYFDDVLAVAAEMQDQEDLICVFIGEGSRREEVKKYVEDHHLANVVMLPFLHESYPLAEILSAGDVHLVPLRASCTGLAVPSKAYGILAAGRPMIYQGSQNAEIARMISDEGVGCVVSCGDTEGLKQNIQDYLRQPQICEQQGLKARKLAEGAYGRVRALEQYGLLLTKDGSKHS